MNYEMPRKTKTQTTSDGMITSPVDFGVLKSPKIEPMCFTEEQRQQILRKELLWIMKNKD